jgi:hypothetical protein
MVAALAAPVRAETRRVAVLVGHNAGGAGRPTLRWAEDDAGKVADVLVQLGDVRPADLFLVQGKGGAQVRDAITAAAGAVRSARNAPDDRVVLYFYYSGHSDGSAIELGADRLPFAELKALLTATGADVRVVIVDACKSGALVAKGGRPGPAFSVDLVDDLTTRGEAMLTSSAADEQSLESSEVRGSFFTHHLVSGLRGAADSSGDGRVTLSEAYDYAFGKTVTSSAATGATPQHPSYDYRLSGRGELVLTEIGARSAAIELPAGFDRALVVAVRRDQIIAEVRADAAHRIAVAPGSYAVRLWRSGAVVAGRLEVGEGALATVRWDDLRPIDVAQLAPKGDAVAAKDDALTPEAQREYDASMLSFSDDQVVVVGDRSARLAVRYRTYLGKYRREIDLEEFLRRVGRNDLAETYASRRTLQYSMFIGGGVVLLAGFTYAVSGQCDRIPGVRTSFDTTCIVEAIGVALAGSLVMTAAGLVPNRPAPPDEMRRMADEHNLRLHERLQAPPRPPAGPSITFVPYVAPHGGGAGLVVRF